MSDEQRVMAIKSLERRTQEHLTGLSQAMGGYRGVCEAMNAQLDRQAAEIARPERINADLLDALKNLVDIIERDNKGDPDYIAGDSWRDETLELAQAAIVKAMIG